MRGKAAGRANRIGAFTRADLPRLPQRRSTGNTMRTSQSQRWRRRLEKSCQKRLSRPVLLCLKRRASMPKSLESSSATPKFEFGQIDGQLILIDEIFTPDSSRFWPKDAYQPGGSPPSFDKQYVRDYLSEIGWKQRAPGT